MFKPFWITEQVNQLSSNDSQLSEGDAEHENFNGPFEMG